jgi:uncharacterized membrane protein
MVNQLVDIWQDLYHFSLMIGGIFLVTGLITKLFPPKKINLIYGYRTQRSMKDPANWALAQQFSSKELMRGGWILVVFSFTGLIYPVSAVVDTIAGLLLMIVCLVVMMGRTETQLKRFENSRKKN